MSRKIFKTGHSIAVTIPSKLLKLLGWKLGDEVGMELSSDEDSLVIRPGNRQRLLPLNLQKRRPYKI